jgi:hypothetical protein
MRELCARRDHQQQIKPYLKFQIVPPFLIFCTVLAQSPAFKTKEPKPKSAIVVVECRVGLWEGLR